MRNYLSLVKFSHTIFALPFALVGYFLAVSLAQFNFEIVTLVQVVLCMVFARNAAMAFNRWQDRDIDGLNTRTQVREIPAGILKPNSVLFFVVVNCIAFIVTTYFINQLCFYLSPVALIVILGYSYTKRFTALCHVILGLGLSLAPVGAFMAVTGEFGKIAIFLGLAVLFWVAGFDIIYALQDEEFDKSLSLHSTPVWLGKGRALLVSKVFHVLSASFLANGCRLILLEYDAVDWMIYAALTIFVSLLIYQHTLVSKDDLSKVNLAFFTTNGVASILFGLLIIGSLFL